MSDPQTPDEWQAAVDGAGFLLMLDAAQQYGLIVGAEGINAERCQEILERGADLGIFPSSPDLRQAEIGRWLRRSRHALGVTQHQIAERASVSTPWISQIERGRFSCSVAQLARLRAAIEGLRKEQKTNE